MNIAQIREEFASNTPDNVSFIISQMNDEEIRLLQLVHSCKDGKIGAAMGYVLAVCKGIDPTTLPTWDEMSRRISGIEFYGGYKLIA